MTTSKPGGRYAFFWKLPKPVIFSSAGAFGCFFGALVGEPVSLMSEGPKPVLYTLIFVGMIGAFLAVGLLLALIAAQNRYMLSPAFSRMQLIKGIPGGIVAGFLSGALAQFIYALLGSNDPSPIMFLSFRFFKELALRSVGWTILGLLLGLAMTFFIPNMKRRQALIAGACGGFIGCVGFFFTMVFFGPTLARFAGGALLGFCIGLAVAIVEEISREVWAEIEAPDGSVRKINLGDTPIHVGSGGGNPFGDQQQFFQAHQSGFQIRKVQQGFMLEAVNPTGGQAAGQPVALKPGEEFSVGTDSLQLVKIRIRGKQ